MLLNKYQRQQRLRPEDQIDPVMRSMMDAVRQVYETKEELVEVPEEMKTELHEELLTEGVPTSIMNTYVQWLGGTDGPGYESGAPYAIQSLHMQLMTVWFCLDFHWDKDRPWAATDKGMQIMQKVMKDLKTKSDMAGGLRQAHINESRVNCVDVWDSLFENKESKKRWGVKPNHRLTWKVNQKLFGLDKKSNPYGDIGGNTQRGEGFYLKMLMQKKMIVKVKPGQMNTDQNPTTGKFAV